MAPSVWLIRHDKGEFPHEEVRSSNGRGVGSPEHRRLRCYRQGQGPAAGRHERLISCETADMMTGMFGRSRRRSVENCRAVFLITARLIAV